MIYSVLMQKSRAKFKLDESGEAEWCVMLLARCGQLDPEFTVHSSRQGADMEESSYPSITCREPVLEHSGISVDMVFTA
jgi:hypothetical protein